MSNILEQSYRTYLAHIESQQVNLHTYEAMIDREVFDLYEINGQDLEQILREQGTPASYFPVVEGFELVPDDMLPEAKEYISNLPRVNLAAEKLDKMGAKLVELYESGKSIEEIAVALEINPVSVAAMRAELDIVDPKDLKNEVENLLTNFILEQLKEDKDGIIPLSDEMHEKSMEKRLIEDLEAMFGEDAVGDVLNEMERILGRKLKDWLSKDFFKKHSSQYKKRPIVWHISSKKGHFEVFLYYHKLTNQTLHILKNIYLTNILEFNNRKLKELQDRLISLDGKEKSKVYAEIEAREDVQEDLQKLNSSLTEVMKLGLDPVIDDGVLANISPFQKADLLSKEVLDDNQLKKGLALLDEYIAERKAAH
jgi:uncharacterized protein with ACT and thioredoxin-like domain